MTLPKAVNSGETERASEAHKDAERDTDWAPERIYLQREQGEGGSHTWCEDSVGDDMIEEVAYVRADIAGAGLDADTVTRLKLLLRKLDLEDAVPSEVLSDPKALFAIFGQMRRKIDRLSADEPTNRCEVPPAGWSCSREKGHSGPCAASTQARAAAPQGLTDDVRQQIDSALDMLMRAMRAANWEGDAAYRAGEKARALLAEQSAAPMAVRTHTTQPGESVMGIALRECGNEKEWHHILACNPQFADMLPHEYFPVGTVLTLPPLPRASEQADEAVKRLRRALYQIAHWPDGGNAYGQEKIKNFAIRILDGDPVEAKHAKEPK